MHSVRKIIAMEHIQRWSKIFVIYIPQDENLLKVSNRNIKRILSNEKNKKNITSIYIIKGATMFPKKSVEEH